MNSPLFIFGWPGRVGGASTKLMHLAPLLHRDYDITYVPNVAELKHADIRRFLDSYGIKYSLFKTLPSRLEGVAYVCCHRDFFVSGLARKVKERGLRIVWSNEMMWEFPGDAEAARGGVIDKVHYVSEFQRQALRGVYGNLPWVIAGNYICPELYPYSEKHNETFNVGRLSRPDPDKYPDNFPAFYESLEVPEAHYWVMAWDDALRLKYRWHSFGDRWHLLGANKESTVAFLKRLDLFVYPLGHRFRESWGRSTVEAMLSGVPPLVPAGHQFENLMVHEESGFICKSSRDFKYYANQLYDNAQLRRTVAAKGRRHAEEVLCNREQHLARWKEALTC